MCVIAALGINASAATHAHAAAAGAVASYAFSEGTGTVAADKSGNGNQAVLSNVKWTSGRFGNGVAFNGSSSLAQVAESASLDLSTGMTLSAWVKASSGQTGSHTLVAKTRAGGGFPYGLEVSSGKPQGFARMSSGRSTATGPDALTAGRWVFVAVTYDGSTIRLYRD